MHRFFGRKEDDKIIIDGGECFHMKKVLRMNEKDNVIACVNDENDYYCTIENMNKDNAVLTIDRIERNKALPNRNIVLFQMLPKKDYFDEILPKAIELGVNEIYFFTSQYSSGKNFKRERVDSQVLSACKQCERSILVPVHDVLDFEDMIKKLDGFDTIIFANEHEKDQHFTTSMVEDKDNIAVVIGGEGGFSEDEAKALIKQGASSFTLGSRILRCDTAVVSVLTLVGIFSNN